MRILSISLNMMIGICIIGWILCVSRGVVIVSSGISISLRLFVFIVLG